jgi:hypothetical protein
MRWTTRRTVWAVVATSVTVAVVAAIALVATSGPRSAPAAGELEAGPVTGPPTVVTLGDSYLSGEAGRWAGNTEGPSSSIDALGPTAYFDDATDTAESTPGCHRSKAAAAHIGDGVVSVNLACSGARTTTVPGPPFKPGLDFFDDGAGRVGQARALQDLARTANVRMVVVSIGGNDFGFADVVGTCVKNYLLSLAVLQNLCSDDTSVTENFTASAVAERTAAVAGALGNIRTAMAAAGYRPSQYRLVVQNYPSPIPAGSAFRYPQAGRVRQTTGGCGFWDRDADWAEDVALVSINAAVAAAAAQAGDGVRLLDVSRAFDGRRLCENTVGLLEEKGLGSWRDPAAVDRTEWVSSVRTVTAATGDSQVQESLHPSYWGQLALRNCLRQAYAGGSPRGGRCARTGDGLTARGEPVMTLS